MINSTIKKCILGLLVFLPTWVFAFGKGLYLTEYTALIPKKMQYFIQQAKELGVDTFVIDTEFKNTRYEKNIKLVKDNGIRFVARITVFPDGGTPAQVKSRAYWEKCWKNVQYALSLGASEIQLDYIRYKASQKPSPQNAKDIFQVIQFFKDKMKSTGIPLQLDVFGISTIKPSVWIGQNLPLFATAVDALNPMVYPSHFEPFRIHAVTPYETVNSSIHYLKKQLGEEAKRVRIYAYIEQTNYRYPLTYQQKLKYFAAQMKGAQDAGVTGWYVWSPNNKYNVLFQVLRDARNGSSSAKTVAENAGKSTQNTATQNTQTTQQTQSSK